MSDPVVILTDHHAAPTPAGAYAGALAPALNAQLLLQPLAVDGLLSVVGQKSADPEATRQALVQLAYTLPVHATVANADEMLPEQAGTVLRHYHPQLLVLNRPAGADGAETVRAVAAELLFNMPYPLLVVPHNAPAVIPRRIAMAVDGGEFNVGEAAVMVRQLLRATNGALTVLHVAEPGEAVHAKDAMSTVHTGNLLPANTETYLQGWISRVPAKGILEAAQAAKADLLVMVARRRSFWGSLLHTSVTTDVLGRCPIPVLLLPTLTAE